MKKKPGIDSLAVHGGDEFNIADSVVPPIWHSVNYIETSVEHLAESGSEIRPLKFYPRYNSPLINQLSKQISALEKTEDALLFGSGMSAISTAIICSVKSGDHIVAQKNLYAGTMKLLRDILPEFRVTTTFVDQEDNNGFRKAIQDNTKLIYTETPSNPLLKITDLKFIGKLGRKKKLLTMVDSTFGTPVNQNPSEFGIDVTIHSATKFLGGHNDLMAGVLCGRKEFINKAWDYSHVVGNHLSAFDASLLLRGIKTLALRVRKQNANAEIISKYLSSHRKVGRVFYPGLKSFKQHKLAKQQMKGFGGMLSFELKTDYDQAKKFLESLKLCKITVSLGGVSTLVTLPVSMWKPYYSKKQLTEAGLSETLIRMSVGIEDSDDIIKDLERGLGKLN